MQKVLNIVLWLTGIIVSLSVSFGMINGTLGLPNWLGGMTVASIAGWIVLATTLLGVILAIIDYFN
ncbi:MAG TPA: hypothetical protein P5277_02170 [Candidatus Paceibacterota bacterium]|nr:hypothetical protein [Candidatus Paceibacterota bacterium]